MKKIFFLLLLLPFLVSAQKTTPGNYTYIAQKYEWDAGVFKGLGLPAGSGPAAFITGQVQRAGAIYWDTLGSDAGMYIYNGASWVLQGSGGGGSGIDTIYRTPGIDSIYYVKDGITYAVKDSVGGNLKVQRGGVGIPIWWNNTVDTALVLKDIIGETFISVGTKTDSTNYVRLDTASTGLKDYIANNISAWVLTGNSGLSAATNFVGNIDSVDLVFRTKNESNLILTANRKLLFDSAHVTDPAHSVIFHVPVGASLDGFLVKPRNNVSAAKQFEVRNYLDQSIFNVTGSTVNIPAGAVLSVQTVYNTGSARGQILLNSSGTSNTNGLINLSGDVGTTPVVVARNMGNNSNKVLDIRDYLNASNGYILGDGSAKLTNLLLPNQTAPGTPASGLGILYPKTSDKKLYWKDDAGVEYDLTGGSSAATGEITKTIYLASPTTADDITYYYSDSAITVTKVADVLTGTSPSVTYNVFFAATRNSGTPDSLFSSPRTTTSIAGATTTTFNDNTIPAGSWIWMKTYATSGTVNDISINMLYPGAGGSGGGAETDPIVGAVNGIVKADGAGTISAAIAGTDYVTPTGTTTLTNKRWTPRVGSTTSSATPTINTDNVDIYKLTAQAADITSFTTNLTGTPVDGDILEIQITGTAARAITWGASFVASTVALPTTTVTTTTLSVVFQYFTTSSYGNNTWVCVNSF